MPRRGAGVDGQRERAKGRSRRGDGLSTAKSAKNFQKAPPRGKENRLSDDGGDGRQLQRLIRTQTKVFG